MIDVRSSGAVAASGGSEIASLANGLVDLARGLPGGIAAADDARALPRNVPQRLWA